MNSSACCSLFCGFRSRADRGRLQAVVLVHNVLSSISSLSSSFGGFKGALGGEGVVLESMHRLRGNHYLSVFLSPLVRCTCGVYFRAFHCLCMTDHLINEYSVKNVLFWKACIAGEAITTSLYFSLRLCDARAKYISELSIVSVWQIIS